MKRAVSYVRISLDATGERAGVTRQRESCEALIRQRGWTQVDLIEDNSVSASTDRKRPGWERVLGMIRRGEVDVVVAWHFDRVTRSMVDLEELIKLAESTGVGIAFAEGDLDLTTGTGRLNARILAAVARGEIERKSSRHRAANEQRALAGKAEWTRRPFGFNRDASHRPAEAKMLRTAYRDVLTGTPINAIARRWNRAGVQTTLGGAWSAGTVRQLLLAPRNAGIRAHRGLEVAEGQWVEIVDLETFRAVQRMIQAPKAGAPGGMGHGYSLLRGMLWCSVCGSGMSRTKRKGMALYACISKTALAERRGGCQTHRAEWLDLYVEERVRQALASQLGGSLWAPDLPAEDVDELMAELGKAEAKLASLAEDYALDLMTREQFMGATETARGRRRVLEDRLALGTASTGLLGLGASPGAVVDRWESLSVDQKRLVLGLLIEEIVCHPRGRLYARNPEAVYDASKIELRWRNAGDPRS